jgi:hypothetical protein
VKKDLIFMSLFSSFTANVVCLDVAIFVVSDQRMGWMRLKGGSTCEEAYLHVTFSFVAAGFKQYHHSRDHCWIARSAASNRLVASTVVSYVPAVLAHHGDRAILFFSSDREVRIVVFLCKHQTWPCTEAGDQSRR